MMNMKKIGYILIVLILILILIILQIYKYKENNSDDIMIFGLWNDIGDKNEYVINPQNHTTVQIDVFKTINNATKVYKKIATGSFGSFVIKLTRPIQSNYEIEIKDVTTKPKNLVFIIDGKKYYFAKEMEEKINEKFASANKIKINWEWKYESSQEEDIEDTKDGENAQRYIFEIKAVIEN